MKVVFECGRENFFDAAKTKSLITVEQAGGRDKLFAVTYGLQRKEGLTYSGACVELGAAILHMQCCEGLASNEGR